MKIVVLHLYNNIIYSLAIVLQLYNNIVYSLTIVLQFFTNIRYILHNFLVDWHGREGVPNSNLVEILLNILLHSSQLPMYFYKKPSSKL